MFNIYLSKRREHNDVLNVRRRRKMTEKEENGQKKTEKATIKHIYLSNIYAYDLYRTNTPCISFLPMTNINKCPLMARNIMNVISLIKYKDMTKLYYID